MQLKFPCEIDLRVHVWTSNYPRELYDFRRISTINLSTEY